MKAVLLHGYGDVDQLEYADAPDPIPEAGEALVALIATSVNPIDYKLRHGAMKDRMPLKFPTILGRDLVGRVVELGAGVTQVKVGDHVMGLASHTYAELVRCQAGALTRVPEGLNAVDAGALPLVTITGAQLVERGVEPKEGQTVLVTGALGSVGRTAVYVARQHGCKVIAGVRSSQKEDARALGASAIAALDDDAEVNALPELDAVADTIGGEVAGKIASKLRRSGVFASVLGEPDAAKKAGANVKAVWAQPDPKRLQQLAADVRDGKFTIPIAKRLRLSDVREAQNEAERGAAGKIVLVR